MDQEAQSSKGLVVCPYISTSERTKSVSFSYCTCRDFPTQTIDGGAFWEFIDNIRNDIGESMQWLLARILLTSFQRLSYDVFSRHALF